MYEDKKFLTAREILEKDFKIDARGYRPQEVDKYLDIVIRDYNEFKKILKESELEKRELIEDNIRLKQEVRKLQMKLEAVSDGKPSEDNNADLLRRLSNLEKIIYGKE